jgi:uncharacterized protein YndB with AHSA1/START domain
MSTTQPINPTTQVYRIYIKATPQAVWDAITKPEWTARYGYGGRSEYDLQPGGSYKGYTSEAMKQDGVARGLQIPDLAIEGEVIEADAPHKLVLKWHMLMDPETSAESFTRLTYEIEETQGGVTKLTLTHDFEGAPKSAGILSGQWEKQGAGGGWNWVLSDLKSLIETGHGFMG